MSLCTCYFPTDLTVIFICCFGCFPKVTVVPIAITANSTCWTQHWRANPKLMFQHYDLLPYFVAKTSVTDGKCQCVSMWRRQLLELYWTQQVPQLERPPPCLDQYFCIQMDMPPLSAFVSLTHRMRYTCTRALNPVWRRNAMFNTRLAIKPSTKPQTNNRKQAIFCSKQWDDG